MSPPFCSEWHTSRKAFPKPAEGLNRSRSAGFGASASDGTFLRNVGIPVYGTSGLANDIDDVRAHGKDERVPVKSFYAGQEYLYRLVKLLASAK